MMSAKTREAKERRDQLPKFFDGSRTIKQVSQHFNRDPSCISNDMKWLKERGYKFIEIGRLTAKGNTGRTMLLKCVAPSAASLKPERGDFRTTSKHFTSTTTSDDPSRAREFQIAYRRSASRAKARFNARAAA